MKSTKTLLSFWVILIAVACTPSRVNEVALLERKIDSLILEMTLGEKIQMIHASSSFTSGGVDRLGIPELVMSDGPHGVRHEHGRDWEPDNLGNDSATYLPTGIVLASTWNRKLGFNYGVVLGNEAKARGKDIILGPGMNIIRSPLNGRNFEYMSEDPYLTSQMAIGYIEGVQKQGIAACAKHYIANNMETERYNVDVYMSERALREIYLPAFIASVQKANVYTIMGAYNKYSGQYCSHNEYLINELLKEEIGFQGILISDWAAVKDTREAMLYGTDIEMGTDLKMLPDPDYNKFFMADSALNMIKRGEIDEQIVDDKVRRILRVLYNTKMKRERIPGEINTRHHQEVALKVAEEGIVLLKNENLLPLDLTKIRTVAVIGHNAIWKHAEGGGSSQVKALFEITPLEGIKNSIGNKVKVEYAQGYEISRENILNTELQESAIKLAKKADVVVFVGGWIHNHIGSSWGEDCYDCEDLDKEDLKLRFGQEKLIEKLSHVNENIAVVVFGGSQVEMNSWKGKVKSILHVGYPGMEGGTAIANILTGNTNPSGKLPVSFANSHLDYPSKNDDVKAENNFRLAYDEGIYVGYRYFEKEGISCVYPFGHGLSYTSFEYSNISIRKKADKVRIEFQLSNTGEYDGAEVVQVYLGSKDSKVDRPIKELKQFEKVFLSVGESKSVVIDLPKQSFAYFNESEQGWTIDPGKYEIMLGSSSIDLRLKADVSW